MLAARQPTWLAHAVNHGQWRKPVAKLCRVGTSATHATFAGSCHRVMHHQGELRGFRGVQRAGTSQQAVLRDLQRHPSRGYPLHADFLRVDKTHKITMNVPLHFINEDTCPGVKLDGGEVQHNASEVEVSCLPQDLPEFIEVDMAEAVMDQIIHLSDLTLPKGVELVQLSHDHDLPVASVHAKKVAKTEDDSAEAEGDEGAEGGEE